MIRHLMLFHLIGKNWIPYASSSNAFSYLLFEKIDRVIEKLKFFYPSLLKVIIKNKLCLFLIIKIEIILI
jgi:hypothetical protein